MTNPKARYPIHEIESFDFPSSRNEKYHELDSFCSHETHVYKPSRSGGWKFDDPGFHSYKPRKRRRVMNWLSTHPLTFLWAVATLFLIGKVLELTFVP